jgi:hypothetical protein
MKLSKTDYSDIEKRLTAALESKSDIHKVKAASMFGVNYADVTEVQRRAAKRIAFPYMYGVVKVLGQYLLPAGGLVMNEQLDADCLSEIEALKED